VAVVGAALLILLALQSVIERYDTTLFSVHMVQHLLLLFPIPILLLRAAPVTLLLRLASPRWRARLLALLQSRAVGVVSHPLVAWILLAFVMWATHLSPLFDAALENPLIHDLEHLLYLTTALLFWAPVFSLDPIRHRLSRPAALAYLFTQMPQNSFLGVAIMWSPRVLYSHYENLNRSWGPSPLEDQQLAGALMWLVGDALFLLAIFAVLATWMRAEERPASRYDTDELARELAEIRRREVALAERQKGEAK
jgi:putative copper resistance protein D